MRILLLIIPLLFWTCKQVPPSNDEAFKRRAEVSKTIEEWMQGNSEFPQYNPLWFGDPNPRYERTPRSMQIEWLVEAEQAQSPNGSAKLDSLKKLQDANRGILLGYIMLHRYETTNLAGERKISESLFFLDTALRIATMLDPEAFDQILIERHMFRLDPPE